MEKLREDELLESLARIEKKQQFLLERLEEHALMQKEHLTLQLSAKYLGVSESTMYKLSALGKVRKHKAGKRCMFKRKDLDDYLSTNSVESHAELERQAEDYTSRNIS